MDLALQLFFTGLGIGAVYALVALGFVLIFRATNVVNFAQGEFAMVGAYLMVVFAVDLHWPYGWAFVAALAGMALLGVVFNLGVYYPLRHRTFLPVIIATIGASIFLANAVLALYGPQPQVLSPWFETQGLQIEPVYLDTQYLIILAVTFVLVAFNFWFFEYTAGKKLRRPRRTRRWPRCSAFPWRRHHAHLHIIRLLAGSPASGRADPLHLDPWLRRIALRPSATIGGLATSRARSSRWRSA
jgi:branched-subunit amino acid ABC-type transport system permease component